MRQAYDYWQDQPGFCRSSARGEESSELDPPNAHGAGRAPGPESRTNAPKESTCVVFFGRGVHFQRAPEGASATHAPAARDWSLKRGLGGVRHFQSFRFKFPKRALGQARRRQGLSQQWCGGGATCRKAAFGPELRPRGQSQRDLLARGRLLEVRVSSLPTVLIE